MAWGMTALLLFCGLSVADTPSFYRHAENWHETLLGSYHALLETLESDALRTSFEAYRSDVMRRGGEAHRIDLSLSGVETLWLIVDDGGDGSGHDHADWCDAKLIHKDGQAIDLTTLTPISAKQGWSTLHIDENLHGRPLKIAGREFQSGLATHAHGEIAYRLDGNYERFQAWVGIDDIGGKNASVRFRVTNNPGIETLQQILWERAARDFRDERSMREMQWEREDSIWDGGWNTERTHTLAKRYAQASHRVPGIEKRAVRLAAAAHGREELRNIRRLYLRSREIARATERLRRLRSEPPHSNVTDIAERVLADTPDERAYLSGLASLKQRADLAIQAIEDGVPGAEESVLNLIAQRDRHFSHEIGRLSPIAFFTRHPFDRPFGLGTYPSWDIVLKWGCSIRIYDPSQAEQSTREIFSDPEGAIFDMNVSYDAKTLFFSYRRKGDDSYHIYEIGTDGKGLKQITSGPYHDVHPLLLPDGDLLFVSTRGECYALCQPGASASMHVMERDGSNVRRISANTLHDHSPQILPDGTVLFTRWEYIDRALLWRQALWTMNPDGTRLRLFFGNTIRDPAVFWQARPLPGRAAVVATFAPHHGYPHGAIGTVWNRLGVEAQRGDGFRWITREFSTIEDRQNRWSYRDPFPVNQHLFLVSYGGGGLERFRIFLLDDRDNKMPVCSDPDISCYNPLLLQPREPPPVIQPAPPNDNVEYGTFLVADVNRGLTGVPPGEAKAIQIMEQIPKPCNMQGLRAWDMDPLIGRGTYYVKKIWGTVPIEADGSAFFRAPANREIYFQTLDADGKEIQRMGSATQIRPGEMQSCVGCHEHRSEAPPRANYLLAAEREPSMPQAPDWGNQGHIDFVQVVQPVLDRYCIECHSGPAPKRGLDLSGDKTRWFSMAYNDLIQRKLVHYVWLLGGPYDNIQPRTTGAQVSKLLEFIDGEHCGQSIPLLDRRRVYNWIDANVPYYGTYDHTRPGTPGSRDLWKGAWFTERFMPVFERRCGGCHDSAKMLATRDLNNNEDSWLNFTHPQWSRSLLAPLAKDAGGAGLCVLPKKAPAGELFMTREDPDFIALLRAIDEGAAEMDARPRVDMAGGRPVAFERNFGRVFTGFAGP